MTAKETGERSGRRRKLQILIGVAAAAGVIAGLLRVSHGELRQGLLSLGAAALFLIALFLTSRE